MSAKAPSYESLLNIATADRAIITRLDGSPSQPERWYILVATASPVRVAGVCDRDGFIMLWETAAGAANWLEEQRPGLVVTYSEHQARDSAEEAVE